MKRQRGRSRNNNNNKSGNSGNRSYDSSGPDVKVRGNASQVHEKYVALARDAASSGNRVKAENLRQHAEHYLRLANVLEEAKQAAREEADARRQNQNQNQNQNQASNDDNDGSDNSDDKNNKRSRRYPPRAGQGKSDDKAQATDGLEVVTPEGTKPAPKPRAKPKPKDKTQEIAAEASDDAPKPARRRKAPTKEPKPAPSVDAAE